MCKKPQFKEQNIQTRCLSRQMLEARELCKSFNGTRAVNRVSFTIEPGEILGYLGPNGSGKSTTVKMITGLLEPTLGHVYYRGHDITEAPVAYKSHLGYVPEEPNLYSYLTGFEYLQMVGRLRGLPERVVQRRSNELLNLFGLGESRFSVMTAYSKGMRQKVLIAAALLADPDVLIFDEPLSGLDVTTALVFRRVVQMLAQAGKIILYSSHVLDVVEKISTRVIILRKGEVVANDSAGKLRELMASPSLEDVFSQLVVEEDTESIAANIVSAMRN